MVDISSGSGTESSRKELDRLAQPAGLSEFQRERLEKDSKKNWDLFYKRNGDRFFKNRYWTKNEFSELFEANSESAHPNECCRFMLEVGCGCGDFILPLLETDKAIELLKSKEAYKRNSPKRLRAFVANVITDGEKMISELDHRQMDYLSVVFVLSALEPGTVPKAIENIHRLMKPGGLVLFRDYANHDKAMLRFDQKSKISDRFYARQDGTRAYFFTKEELLDYFTSGRLFSCQTIEYIHRETINNATQDKHSRIFLQAKFRCLKKE